MLEFKHIHVTVYFSVLSAYLPNINPNPLSLGL